MQRFKWRKAAGQWATLHHDQVKQYQDRFGNQQNSKTITLSAVTQVGFIFPTAYTPPRRMPNTQCRMTGNIRYIISHCFQYWLRAVREIIPGLRCSFIISWLTVARISQWTCIFYLALSDSTNRKSGSGEHPTGYVASQTSSSNSFPYITTDTAKPTLPQRYQKCWIQFFLRIAKIKNRNTWS